MLISVSVIAVKADEVTPRNYAPLTEEALRRKVAAYRRMQRSVARSSSTSSPAWSNVSESGPI
jgi:hypothetical protein